MNKAVCAILVTYNRVESLKIALEHIFNQSVQPSTLIIVDNCSSDRTREYLTALQNSKNIHCLFLSTNIGAGGGYTAAMTYALENNMNPSYFWMIEDDTYYEPGVLSELLHHIETAPYDMISLKGFETGFRSTRNIICNDTLQPVSSALLDGSLIKAEIIRKIGPPKKEYFMMCDDYEFSLRLKKNNYKIGLIQTGAAHYLHLGGDGKFTQSTLWRGYYTSRNHLLILREYFSVFRVLSYFYKQTKYLVAAAVYAPDRYKRIKFRLFGIWHGIRGVQGKTLDPSSLRFIKTNDAVTIRKPLVHLSEPESVVLNSRHSVSNARFTIITPTYNRAVLIQRTIRSILAQTFSDWEYIIIDDGSTDNTEEVVQQFLRDSRIKYIKKKNTGGADSRNVGASYAHGEFITFLDSDDEAYPHWLETINSHLRPDSGIACAGALKQFPDGSNFEDYPYEINVYGEKKKVKFTCGSFFIKRSIFLEVKGYDTEMPTGLQSELGYRILGRLQHSNLKIVSIEQCLVCVHLHDGERMRSDWKSLTRDCERFVNKFYPYFNQWDKKELSNNYTVLAFYNYMLNQRKQSFFYLMKAIRLRPLHIKNYFRIVKYMFI
jgi:rhamnopyranosyl-N-acetylglucosaminyl-diphospho-decaprenol beta-1,3/1,4-galactofuranosyltransferase